MFRIVCMVEDKNLPKVLHAMAGLVLSMEPPQPVVNATVEKGVVKQAQEGTTIKARLTNAISSLSKGTNITIAEIRELVVAAGGDEGSANHYTGDLQRQKIIKLVKRGHYIRL